MAPLERNATIPHLSLARLKRILSAGNAAALALGAWTLFWPIPYFPLLAICFTLPLFVLALDMWARGALMWEQSGARVHGLSLVTILMMPALALCARALSDLNIMDWPMMITWSLLGALSIAAGFVRLDERVRRDWRQLISVVFFSLAYGYGTLAMANVVLDSSTARTNRTVIRDMRIHVSGGVKGSSIWHEVAVDPDTSPKGKGWIHVRPDVYAHLRKGERACIHLGRGLLGVRWFDVRPCPRDES